MTGLESRIVRIEKSRPPRGSLEYLTIDEIEELQRSICVAIVNASASSPEVRAGAQSDIDQIEKERDDRQARRGSRYIEGPPDDARMTRAANDFLATLDDRTSK